MEEKNAPIRPVDQSVPCDALQGIRVVELTTYVAAPMCGRMLADYGAEVIKVESVTGDPWRSVGKNVSCPATDDENPMFDVLNSGKKSAVLNLKDPDDMDTFQKLLATADVFLTNTRMKSLRKLGLDPETLGEKYPTLVFAFLSGYGIDGPEKDEPGYDSVSFWARSGLMRDITYVDSGYPMAIPTGVGDSICGSMLVSGILAALLKRGRTGKGDFVNISLLGASIWTVNNMVVMTQEKYKEPFPITREQSNPSVCNYKCADGEWIQIGVQEYDRYMPKLLEVLGRDDIANDPHFRTQAQAKPFFKELYHILVESFSKKTCQEWLDLIKPLDIVCCRLPHFSDLASDQQAWANGNLETFRFRNDETCVMPCPPVRFGSTGTSRSTWAPLLGEHTEEVRKSVGK